MTFLPELPFEKLDPEKYLDHSATSYPKPPEVLSAFAEFLTKYGGNPGRSSHYLSLKAEEKIYSAREKIATFFHFPYPERVIFTLNGTSAINLMLRGVLSPGDHVITTTVEHNAVARTLNRLSREGISVEWAPTTEEGEVLIEELTKRVTPKTKMVVVTGGSNVLGTIQDLKKIRTAIGQTPLLAVDGCQIAGEVPLSILKTGIDLFAFSGHKGLLGPPGVGSLLVSPRVSLRVLREGGTGVRSEEPFTPETFPEGYEAGTPNGPGIYALMKGIEVIEKGYREERKEEVLSAFLEELSTIPGLTIYSQKDPKKALPLVSFRIEGVPCQSLAIALSEQYGFMVRAGLHCAPHAHKTIGTLDTGLVRVSFGPKIRKETARKFRDALREILQVGGIRAEKR